eukprot:g3161.t1
MFGVWERLSLKCSRFILFFHKCKAWQRHRNMYVHLILPWLLQQMVRPTMLWLRCQPSISYDVHPHPAQPLLNSLEHCLS